jgi:hypothetical protein
MAPTHEPDRERTHEIPPWPSTPPAHGAIVLREFSDDDVHFAIECGEDPLHPHDRDPSCPSEHANKPWNGFGGSETNITKEQECRSLSPMSERTGP